MTASQVFISCNVLTWTSVLGIPAWKPSLAICLSNGFVTSLIFIMLIDDYCSNTTSEKPFLKLLGFYFYCLFSYPALFFFNSIDLSLMLHISLFLNYLPHEKKITLGVFITTLFPHIIILLAIYYISLQNCFFFLKWWIAAHSTSIKETYHVMASIHIQLYFRYIIGRL